MIKPSWLVNFELADFQCRCAECQKNPDRPHTKLEVIHAVQKLRTALGIPLVISCGVRCAAHNAAVAGAPDSRHLPEHADAIDIAVADPQEAMRVLSRAMVAGDYQREPVPLFRYHWTAFERGKHHVHLDARPQEFQIFLPSPE